MTEWKPIEKLFDFEKGTLQSSKCSAGKYTFITAAEEWKTHKDFTHNCEALVFAMAASGSLGRTHYVKGKFIASDLCFILTPKKELKIDLSFYHRLFNFLRPDIVNKTKSGTSKLSINQTNFGAYKLPYFDYKHQLYFKDKMKYIANDNETFLGEIDYQLNALSQLRQSVLQEAIEGKLTAEWRKQNPELITGENHALKLLEKIKAEKERLIKEGKIKKDKSFLSITADEKAFDLPDGWVWVRLVDLVSLIGDGLHGTPNYSNNGEYFFINGNNLNEGEILIKDNTKRVSLEEYKKYKKELTQKTVLVSINGTLGNVAFYNNEKIILGKSACYINLLDSVNKHYIMQIIKTKYFLIYASDKSSETTIKNLSLKGMRMFLVPLPSVAEQQAIVERVDKLMAQIDELEKQVTERKAQAEQLMQSVLHEAFSEPKA